MKNLKIIVFVLFSFVLTTRTYTQGNVSIHFGSSLPVSDFQSDDINDEDAGGAKIGINIGLKYRYLLTEGGLGIFCGIDLNHNKLQNDFKDHYEELYGRDDIAKLDYQHLNYYNIPISTGLNYNYRANDNIGVFADFGLVLNFLKVSDFEVEADNNTIITSIKSDPAYGIGYKIGGGIQIKDKILFTINYLGLGEHDNDREIKRHDYADTEYLDSKLKIDLFTFTLGYMF
jgi:hypothetical protein